MYGGLPFFSASVQHVGFTIYVSSRGRSVVESHCPCLHIGDLCMLEVLGCTGILLGIRSSGGWLCWTEAHSRLKPGQGSNGNKFPLLEIKILLECLNVSE